MTKAARLLGVARLLPKLGLRNVARVAAYRARLAAGWRPKPGRARLPTGPVYFASGETAPDFGGIDMLLFGWHRHKVQHMPDWHVSPLDPASRMAPDQDWLQALTALGGRDPKPFWEMSRFYWVPQFAIAGRAGDAQALARLEAWLQNWIVANPPYRGIQWACGQEAAIRLMNLALAAILLDEVAHPQPALRWLVEQHARRILPTFGYALGQDNNHGSAEACALFIAGVWGRHWAMPGADGMARLGRRWLNDRATRLIQADGSPSQYSTTYHRANLETFSLAELWACRAGVASLNPAAHERIAEGARWLHRIIEPVSGDAPNLGANDGSHLFQLTSTPYRDFRPTIVLAARLFDAATAGDASDARVSTFDLPAAQKSWPPPASATGDEGGFHVLRQGRAFGVLRYPRFRFRPSQADALHFDLFVDGQNLLRDAGTFSYASEDASWFAGTGAHNTVEFDGRDQMPRLGRFLFGYWLDAGQVEAVRDFSDRTEARAGYRDASGARHDRAIVLRADGLTCTDQLSGSAASATLRWRLAPGDWTVTDDVVTNGSVRIRIGCDQAFTLELNAAAESRHYLERGDVPVIEVKTTVPATITSEMSF